MSFCVEAAVEAVGGEEALEPGDILLYNYPYGTGSHPQDAAVVMPVFLHDERAHRLRGDQGALARHRRQGAVLDRHRRRLPGGRRSSRASSSTARGELVARHLPDGPRELARARRWSPATSTPRSSACAPAPRRSLRVVERYGLEAFRDVASSGCSTTARRSSASYFEQHPGRPLRRPRGDGRRRRHATSRSRSRSCSRSRARRCASTTRARRTQQPGPVNCPLAVDGLGQPGRDHRCSPAAARRRTRGTSAPIEVVTRPGLDVPPAPAGAVLPVRLAGDAGDRGHLPGAGRGAARGGAGVQRRRHLLRSSGGARARRRASRGPTARRTRSARARTTAATARAA